MAKDIIMPNGKSLKDGWDFTLNPEFDEEGSLIEVAPLWRKDNWTVSTIGFCPCPHCTPGQEHWLAVHHEDNDEFHDSDCDHADHAVLPTVFLVPEEAMLAIYVSENPLGLIEPNVVASPEQMLQFFMNAREQLFEDANG